MGSRTRRNRSRPIHPDVTTWVNKVAAAGDGVPASALVANREFVKRCFVGGFWQSKMRNGLVATLSANTLTGAIVPYGSFTMTNNNFVSGDYSLSTGLGSNPNTTKYLSTDYVPDNYLNIGTGQISAYCRTNRQESSYPVAGAAYNATDGGDPRMALGIYTDPNTYWDYPNYATNGRTFRSFSSSLGLTSGSRISTTDSRIYQNGSQVGATNTTTASGSMPVGFFRFYRNPQDALPNETRTFSYFYVGSGLTPAEEAQHYQAVQLMQMRLNRAV